MSNTRQKILRGTSQIIIKETTNKRSREQEIPLQAISSIEQLSASRRMPIFLRSITAK